MIRLILILKMTIDTLNCFIYDMHRHFRYFANFNSGRLDYHTHRCRLLLLNHQLEKAQTYADQKDGYGKDKLIQIIALLEKYIKFYGIDDLVRTSVGILASHIENNHSWKDDTSVSKIHRFQQQLGDLVIRGGVDDYFFERKKGRAISELLLTRKSCRVFSGEKIDLKQINQAIQLATLTPSACNRQTVRVHYYDSKEKIRSLVVAQKADIEWCLNSTALLVITSNISYYRNFLERNQYMFDAGLFSMTLNLVLHDMGIGSCFKMAQKHPSIDSETRKIGGIPAEEEISVLMCIGKYPNESVKVACSNRVSADTVLTVHN